MAHPSFHLFPNLPFDIRHLIWHHALQASRPRPRTITIAISHLLTDIFSPHDIYAPIPPPVLLLTCRESRIIAVQRYTPLFPSLTGRVTYLDLAADTLHLDQEIFSICIDHANDEEYAPLKLRESLARVQKLLVSSYVEELTMQPGQGAVLKGLRRITLMVRDRKMRVPEGSYDARVEEERRKVRMWIWGEVNEGGTRVILVGNDELYQRSTVEEFEY